MASGVRRVTARCLHQHAGRPRQAGRLSRSASEMYRGVDGSRESIALMCPEAPAQARRALRQELWQRGVLVLRLGQVVSAAALEAFGRATFGQDVLEVHRGVSPALPPELFSPGVQVLGNPLGPAPSAPAFPPERRRGTHSWHVDQQPAGAGRRGGAPYVVMIHAVRTAFPGHATSFADMQAAYEGLDSSRRSWWSSGRMWHLDPYGAVRSASPRSLRPLVGQHAFTGVPCLQVGPGRGRGILEGLEEEAEEVQDSAWEMLAEEAIAAGEVYDHAWERGDVLIFDNSQLLHRSNPYDASVDVRIALRLGVHCSRE